MVIVAQAEPSAAEFIRERAALRRDSAHPELWAVLDAVRDPEIPVVSIWDLGILQDVHMDGGMVKVVITPTYSGCPAMREIEADIRARLANVGYGDVRVEHRLAPAWTTDWLSEAGREALRGFGIAPPCGTCGDDEAPACPQCGSGDTERISDFGSTACKALYRCTACMEPFDYFKRF
jgi:ring-1,2-phenylacetyl-CoA epoxidase subunit PaaD